MSRPRRFHYCEFTNQDTLDAVKLFRSLIRQFCEKTSHISARVHAYYTSNIGRQHDLRGLVNLLANLVDDGSGRCYIVVDGLDECNPRESLLQALLHLLEAVTNNSKMALLLTSRPEYDIWQTFSSMPTLTV